MHSKNWIGYCIKCAFPIPQKVSISFCEKCFTVYKEMNISWSQPIGKYCHVCSCSGQYSEAYPVCKQCLGLDREGKDCETELYEKLVRKFSLSNIGAELTPLWAYQENECYLNSSKPIYSTRYIADLEKLISATNIKIEFDIVDVFKNTPKAVSRILNILERWDSKLFVDPPVIIKTDNYYYFQNGKHRTLAALYLKAETIPIFLVKK